MEVDNDGENDNSRDEVHDIWETVAPEGLPEGTALVIPGEKEVEECDKGTLKLGSASGINRSGREGLPDDRLANIGGDEEVDPGAETVTFLKELV